MSEHFSIATDPFGPSTCMGHSAGDATTGDIMAAIQKAKSVMDEYRASRDLAFMDLRAQGYTIFAVDEGRGEEWVIDDRLYAELRDKFSAKGPVSEPDFMAVRLIPASQYEPKSKLTMTEPTP